MNIKKFLTGSFQTNCYLVWNENKEAYFFDCEATSLGPLFNFVEKENLDLKHIILTHGHGDHICGINKLTEKYPNATLYIGEEDKEFLTNSQLNLAPYIIGHDFSYNGDFVTVKEGDKVGEFIVIDTPGHTIGSKCFYNPEHKFIMAGDTMFRRSFGRYDLPTGNGQMLFKSLRKLCENYPEDTVVYNGHTESTTIGEETRFLKSQGII